MSSVPLLTIKAKIRTRITVIERNAIKYIGLDKANKIRDLINKKLDLKNDENNATGIPKPKIFSKMIFDDK